MSAAPRGHSFSATVPTQEPTVSTILIGVDASERSEDATAFARRLADASGAHVVIANAYPYSDRVSRSASVTYRDALRELSLRTVRAMRDKLDLPEKRSTIKIVANVSPAHALHSMAEAEHACVLVVGSTHTGRVGRVVPGSTGERLLHGSPCTVAVVPQGYRTQAEPIRRIGVAYNASPESRAAAGAAAELARGLDAELVVIGVADPLEFVTGTTVNGPTVADVVREVQHDLDTVARELPVEATTALLTGAPAELLAEYSLHLDVLVTGSRGYGPVRSVLAGGVSGRLMRSAHCPVMIVPRGVDVPLGRLFDLVEQA